LEEYLKKSIKFPAIPINDAFRRSVDYFHSIEGYQTTSKATHRNLRIMSTTEPTDIRLRYELNPGAYFMMIDSVVEVNLAQDGDDVLCRVSMLLRWPREHYSSVGYDWEKMKAYWAEFILAYWRGVGVDVSPDAVAELQPPESMEWLKEQRGFGQKLVIGFFAVVVVALAILYLIGLLT
jgi:hypothetical protein